MRCSCSISLFRFGSHERERDSFAHSAVQKSWMDIVAIVARRKVSIIYGLIYCLIDDIRYWARVRPRPSVPARHLISLPNLKKILIRFDTNRSIAQLSTGQKCAGSFSIWRCSSAAHIDWDPARLRRWLRSATATLTPGTCSSGPSERKESADSATASATHINGVGSFGSAFSRSVNSKRDAS